MKPILAPHKEQDGFCYMRFPSAIHCSLRVMAEVIGIRLMYEGGDKPFYADNKPIQRIISSRRVEEAVETADFLKRCADEGLCAVAVNVGTWVVGKRTRLVGNGTATGLSSQMTFEPYRVGTTLREAYYRYKAAAGDAK